MNDLFLFVDFQKIFEKGDWKVPEIKNTLTRAKIARDTVAKIRNITTIATRYLPPHGVCLRNKDDAWFKYFKMYPNVPNDPDHEMYQHIENISCDLSWESSGFSKWNHSSTYTSPFNVFITGVSTECCVLSTALSAIDAGATVYIISDACAAGSKNDHNLGLNILSRFAPNVQIIKTNDIIRLFNE